MRKIYYRCRKTARTLAVSGLLLAGAAAAAAVIWYSGQTKTTKEEQIQYEYHYTPSASSSTHVVANELIPDGVLPGGVSCPKNLLDYLQIDYLGTFDGSLDAVYTGTYQADIYMRGMQGDLQVWRKDYPPLLSGTIEGEGTSYTIENSGKIYMGGYENFAAQANALWGKSQNIDLVVNLTGELHASTSEGDVTQALKEEFVLPMNQAVYLLSRTGAEPSTGNLKTYVDVVENPEPWILNCGIAASVLLFLSGILFWFFTAAYSEEELCTWRLKNYLKNYGSRMIPLKKDHRVCTRVCEVMTFQEILKLADELEIPIFYVADEQGAVKDSCFYIINQDTRYEYTEHAPKSDMGLATQTEEPQG